MNISLSLKEIIESGFLDVDDVVHVLDQLAPHVLYKEYTPRQIIWEVDSNLLFGKFAHEFFSQPPEKANEKHLLKLYDDLANMLLKHGVISQSEYDIIQYIKVNSDIPDTDEVTYLCRCFLYFYEDCILSLSDQDEENLSEFLVNIRGEVRDKLVVFKNRAFLYELADYLGEFKYD